MFLALQRTQPTKDPTGNIIYNSVILNAFPLTSGKRQEHSFTFLPNPFLITSLLR